MAAIDVEGARKQLLGPVNGTLDRARQLCIEGATEQEIDSILAEAGDLVADAASKLDRERRSQLPIEIIEGKVYLLPPLLFSDDTPDGVLVEDLLNQVISEMEGKQEKERCRETALVITNLEQALLWQQRRGELRGTTKVVMDDPRGS